MNARSLEQRLSGRLFVVSVSALLAVAAYGLLQRDPGQVVAALAAALLVARSQPAALFAVALAVATGEWLVAGVAAGAVVANQLLLWSMYRQRAKLDPSVLQAAFAALPAA